MRNDEQQFRRLEVELMTAVARFEFTESQQAEILSSIQKFIAEVRNETYRRVVHATILLETEVTPRSFELRFNDQKTN